MADTTPLLDFAKTVAREAGVIMLHYFEQADKAVEVKANATLVTIADKEINQLVIDRVAAAFPDHGVLAEEGSSHQERKELWVCDPIDGTVAFIQRVPTGLFSLAYVVDGVPEVAALYDPYQAKLYSAAKGQGAWVNDVPLRVSHCTELGQASIGITTGYDEQKTRRAFFDDLLVQGVNQVIVPGNVFKGTLVACGGIDGYIFPGKSAHDIAAVKLIVEEAGGKVTDLYGKEQRYDGPIYGAIVSNGRLHEALVGALSQFGPENYVGY